MDQNSTTPLGVVNRTLLRLTKLLTVAGGDRNLHWSRQRSSAVFSECHHQPHGLPIMTTSTQ